jgi:ribosomal protein L3 glutamine methyltransferase
LSSLNQKTIRELINDISFQFEESDIFYGHGTDNAFDEAVYLVFSVLDLPFDVSDDQLNSLIDLVHLNRIDEFVIKRITKRIPVAYLVNKAWFSGLQFYVDERVLIPRSPIAELIAQEFKPWLIQADKIKNILDIGTGSGCIAIAAAQTFTDAIVDAVDISQDALDVARINVENYNLSDRVKLLISDIFQNTGQQKYDLIIANPPYVDAIDMDALPAEYRYEPGLGLAAGEDGIDVVSRIIAESKKFLTANGLLIVEVGNSQAAVERAFPELPFTWLEFEHGGEGVFLLTADNL